MQTVTLYRPVGLKELELIMASGFQSFPPRLEWQPIFYPVLNQAYAEQIASEWNTEDAFSGFCGVVTVFELDKEHYSKYDVQMVGGDTHNELWVPAAELEEFNAHIVGDIRLGSVFFGSQFVWPENSRLVDVLSK